MTFSTTLAKGVFLFCLLMWAFLRCCGMINAMSCLMIGQYSVFDRPLSIIGIHVTKTCITQCVVANHNNEAMRVNKQLVLSANPLLTDWLTSCVTEKEIDVEMLFALLAICGGTSRFPSQLSGKGVQFLSTWEISTISQVVSELRRYGAHQKWCLGNVVQSSAVIMRSNIISYSLLADADTGMYPHAALQYHSRPKAKRGIVMLSVDKFPYPHQQTKGNKFIAYSSGCLSQPKMFLQL